MWPAERRIDHEVPEAESVAFSFVLPYASHCARRVRRSGGPIRRTIAGSNYAGSGRATDAGAVAATGGADRVVSGCAGRTDPGSGYLSGPGCRGRPLAAATNQSK